MARTVVISRRAARDLDDVRTWLKQPGAGTKATARLAHIRNAVRELRRTPAKWPFGDHPGVREASVEGYRILYEVTPDTGDNVTAGSVVVLRVFGPGQNRTRLER